MRKTKIICTLGPATDRDGILEQCIESGMNVARLNFSHGSHEEQQKRIDKLYELRKKYQKPIAALLDTKGPEIRLGDFKDGKVNLKQGQKFSLVTNEVLGDETKAYVTYKQLPEDVEPGTRILMDDGLVEMIVEAVDETQIDCVVVGDCELKNHKGVNVPGLHLNMPYMSEKDKSDIIFGINNHVDFIAASFVRTVKDIEDIRAFLHENGGDGIHIIAKIENREGVENIDGIIAASDGIMVARGDMGVELPEEEVPILQKMIIGKVYEAGKQVITATQMLDSMMKNPRPTRAEVADVANAIYDGTSAIMLSGETAMGKYPVDALKMMVSIVEETEAYLDYSAYRRRKVTEENMKNISNAVCAASVSTAHDIGADYIIAPSITGFTSMMLSKWRPAARIIGMSPSTTTVRQMMLQWGVTPVWSRRAESTDELIENSLEELKSSGVIKSGDLAVITAGIVTYARRHEAAAATNIMRVVSVD